VVYKKSTKNPKESLKMMEAPVDLIVAAFPTEQGGKEALHELDEAKKQGVISIRDAAVLTRDENQKLHISDEADKGVGHGALIGGVAGAAVGLLAGPIGWAALGGAAIGGLAGRLREHGFPHQTLKQIGDGLQPGSSAVVAVIEETWVTDVERMLAERGANVATEAVAADIAAQLDREAEIAQQSGQGLA
jgi:uncharacterized membrane protein